MRRVTAWFCEKLGLGAITMKKTVTEPKQFGPIAMPAMEFEKGEQTWTLATVEVTVRSEYAEYSDWVILSVRRKA